MKAEMNGKSMKMDLKNQNSDLRFFVSGSRGGEIGLPALIF